LRPGHVRLERARMGAQVLHHNVGVQFLGAIFFT
jgi:hypothetical protein